MPIGFRDQAGNLAVRQGIRRHGAKMVCPGGNSFCPNRWFGNMVDYEALLRQQFHQFERRWHLLWVDQDVISEVEMVEIPYPTDHVAPEQITVIRLGLHD